MNKAQTNHYRMYLSTQGFLDNHSNTWSSIPRIVSYKIMLDEIITRIQSQAEAAQLNVGVTQQKSQLKKAIATKAALVSGVLQVIAKEQNNDDLATAVKMSYSNFMELRDGDIDAIVKNITSKANENLESLAEFAITEDVITELNTSVEDFNAFIGKPRTILSQKFATLKNIQELFTKGNDILNADLDKSMLIFKTTQSEFYNGYLRVRTIINN